ncbi:MAG: hypothetical protein KDB23_11650 [Planctomycetales bacterium]|nr:hypothetical protein [Planctomycetales bacterium]
MSLDYDHAATFEDTTVPTTASSPASAPGSAKPAEFPSVSSHPETVEGLGSKADLDAFLNQRIVGNSKEIYSECLQFMESFVLTEILRLTQGNQSEAARMLGITRGSLRYKIRACGLTVQRIVQRTPEEEATDE